MRDEKPDTKFNLTPLHVLLLGGGILGSGVLLTASVSYRQAGKQLAADGLDAGIRRHVLPHAVKALAGSLVLTGAAAAGGFCLLQSLGVVSSAAAPADADTFRKAWEMLAGPVTQQQQQQQELPAQKQQQQHR